MEEWTLFEHIAFVARSWKAVVALTILTGVGAYLGGRFFGNSVEGEGLIRIGYTYPIGFVEDPQDVATRISSFAFLSALAAKNPTVFSEGREDLFLEAKASEKSGLIKVSARASSDAATSALIRLTAERIQAEHRGPLEHAKAAVKVQAAEIEARIEELQKDLDAAKTGPEAAEDNSDRLFRHLADLRNQQLEIKLRGDPAVSSESSLIEGPATRVASKRRKIAAFGMGSGFALALLLIYALEYMKRERLRVAKRGVVPAPSTTPDVRDSAK